jgi:hypothetical protein
MLLASMSAEPAPAEAQIWTEAQLWTVLRAYLRQACALFGEPADLARGAFITRLTHKHLCDWLRPLEALARRLLFLMARALHRTPMPAPEIKQRAARAVQLSAGAAIDLDQSETGASPSMRTRSARARISLQRHTPRRIAVSWKSACPPCRSPCV